jgi:radical SAM superfamily enzyme YgiQ (UPF0313 family)
MDIALVNTNRIRPPIGPIGLDYVAEALNGAGHQVDILDLCWAPDWGAAIGDFFSQRSFDLVGMTLRNTDDCAFTSGQSFLEDFAVMAEAVGRHTDAPVIAGGVGFSVMPGRVLDRCKVQAGLWGDGEFGLLEYAEALEGKRGLQAVAGLIWRDKKGGWHQNRPSRSSLAELPPMTRRWIDNRRYFHEGGQAGIETKRGCSGQCIYCADPLAKGRIARMRPPGAVADEIEGLLALGIDHLHTCDSEFNLPEEHGCQVCEEMIRRKLGDKVRWYAYCTPFGFSPGLAKLMARSGCVGINFGVDSGDEAMLRRLKRGFLPEAILEASRSCQQAGITVMLDLLLGAPGETQQSIAATIELVKETPAQRVGVALGVRVYPETELARLVFQEDLRNGLVGEGDGTAPLFFVEPAVAPVASELLDKLIGGDERFFFFEPSRPERNYNYNANQLLEDAIRDGYRGAYWDILRQWG